MTLFPNKIIFKECSMIHNLKIIVRAVKNFNHIYQVKSLDLRTNSK